MRVEHTLQSARAMRAALPIATLALVFRSGLATACPPPTPSLPTDVSTNETPATASPCIVHVDWRTGRRLLEVRYALGAGATTRSGIGSTANAFGALELAYALQFGSDLDQPSYEIEGSAGVAAQRFAGAIDANGLVTRAALRLGPARVAESVVDEGRANFAAFPMTMELAHTGELGARPRISTRPELARALYGRERVELATRVLRVEGAGTKASTSPPGETEPSAPSSWALDVLPLHTGLDVAMQDGSRIETTVGGALMGVVEHTMGAKLDLLGVEYRHVDLPMSEPTSLMTVWMLKLDAVDPTTGTAYLLGWGEVVVPEELQAFARHIDPENGHLTIGGAGWYARRAWGGFGMQYKREPYIAMTGELGLEDRVSGEIYVPRALGLVARGFGARTHRLVDDELVHDFTAGIEIDASYARDSWQATLGLELGRTFYTALDASMPTTTGFVAALGVTAQHTGRRAWHRAVR